MSDLLGCICLYGAECERNCRCYETEWEDRPTGPPTMCLHFDPNAMNDLSQEACHVVEQAEDENLHVDIIGVEAWTDGRILLWTQ